MSDANPGLLRAIPYSADLQEHVADFACGDEPYERELADWIRNEALPAMERGTRVWLFVTEEGDLVGYGSLGTTNWRWPDPKSERVTLNIIPAVAIQRHYWGKPDGPREQRYSTQILDHLIAEATDRTDTAPLLGLFVHPDNHRAIRAYERAGFTRFSHTYKDKETGVVYISMIYPLRRPPQPG
jgi:RimJ/RimL family protein N-acetyltransferase